MRMPKPVGSNHSPKKGKSTMGGRPQRQKEQPQAPTSSHTDEHHSAHSVFEEDHAPMPTSILTGSRSVELHEAQAARRPRPARQRDHTTQADQEPQLHPPHKRTHTIPTIIISRPLIHERRTALQPCSSSSPTSSEDWEQIPDDAPLPTTPPFPSTWPAALQDTTAALTRVTRATLSFASAVASSGIGKASWSVGAATLNSTNKAALAFAGWGIHKTGKRYHHTNCIQAIR
jgi:hypothetical protein